MLKNYLDQFHSWYEERETRERILLIGLSFAVWYGLFSLFVFNPLKQAKETLQTDMKEIQQTIQSLQAQINVLTGLENTPIYQKWISKHQTILNLRSQTRRLLNRTSPWQWLSIVSTLLHSYPQVTLVEIKKMPEKFALDPIDNPQEIEQKTLVFVINANYVDTVSYLQVLEKQLPFVHWDSLDYHVINYPMAKIEIGLSILYAKQNV
jgi:hypothetical protein